MDDYIKKLLDEYKEKRPLYGEFCFCVNNLIKSLLDNKGYKYQILYRVKELDKLEEKLTRRKEEGGIYKRLSEVEDLAGLRIIFYLESDKDKFIKDLQKEISGALKIEQEQKKSGYEAIHITISLGEKRLQLAEYEKFKNLKCELQITSILQHAWAEIEHDIIYKDINKIKEKNPSRFKSIQQKLDGILKHHIKKASSEFDKILNQIKKRL